MAKEKKPAPRNKAPADFDWYEELSYYVAANGYKVLKKKIDEDRFEYFVVDKYKRIVLTIESPRDLRFVKHRKRGKKPKRAS